jgi:hypothetical protein
MKYPSRYIGNLPIPKDKRRACLCRDGATYSRDCCDDDYMNQGIGNITSTATLPSVDQYGYKMQLCGHSKTHHFFGDVELTVGNIYYVDSQHDNKDGCYEALSRDDQTAGQEWVRAFSYADCNECDADTYRDSFTDPITVVHYDVSSPVTSFQLPSNIVSIRIDIFTTGTNGYTLNTLSNFSVSVTSVSTDGLTQAQLAPLQVNDTGSTITETLIITSVKDPLVTKQITLTQISS